MESVGCFEAEAGGSSVITDCPRMLLIGCEP
jgi:hypothetical protein